jgi:NADH dehydrogenase
MQQIKIVIVGNGFGGIYALKGLHKLFGRSPRVHITLVAENNYFLFTPLLHEVATGGVSPENIIEPIHKTIGHYLDQFHIGRVELVDIKSHTVRVGGATIPYDYLVLATGAETNYFDTPGAEQYALPLKSIENAIAIKNRVIEMLEKASYLTDREARQKMLTFVIVGGGPTGVELAGELAEFVKDTFSKYFAKDVIDDIKIILMQKGGELVMQFEPELRAKSLEVLTRKGVHVMLDAAVTEVGESFIKVENHDMISVGTVIWVAGVKPTQVKFDIEVPLAKDGRIITTRELNLETHKEIFVIGDLAYVSDGASPLPQLGQVAVKQGRFVARNIKNMVEEKRLDGFVYKSSGNLMSLGQWMAVGQIGGYTFSGRIMWWIWRTVYLSKLISWQKKLGVAFDWTLDVFSPRDISKF